MLGWRLMLLTVLALALVAIAMLDVTGSDRSGCAHGKTLAEHGLLSQARKAYAAELEHREGSGCAKAGVDNVNKKLCAQAQTLAAANPGEAAKQDLAIAEAEPVRDSAECGRMGYLSTTKAADPTSTGGGSSGPAP